MGEDHGDDQVTEDEDAGFERMAREIQEAVMAEETATWPFR